MKNIIITILLLIVLILCSGCLSQKYDYDHRLGDLENIELDLQKINRLYVIESYPMILESEDGSIWYIIYDTEKQEIKHKELAFLKEKNNGLPRE